jgi:hypothetical protein
MIKNIYTLLIPVFLFSCSSYLPYSATTSVKSITDIPLKASAENIDCFFNNQLPSKTFYRVKITEVTGDAGASYDELILLLKNKARQEGLDGLLILEQKQEMAYENLNEKINVTDTSADYYRQRANPYQKLTAIGIKYRDNINYLDTIVKSTHFEFANGTASMNFDFYGNRTVASTREFNQYYSDSIEPFETDKHLLMTVNGWQYKAIAAGSNEAPAFRKQEGEVVKIDVKRNSNDAHKFSCTFFNPITGRPVKFMLRVEKNSQGDIVKKTLYRKEAIVWVEEISYAKNVAAGYKRYRLNAGKEEMIFTAGNQYFSLNDLPAPLSN